MIYNLVRRYKDLKVSHGERLADLCLSIYLNLTEGTLASLYIASEKSLCEGLTLESSDSLKFAICVFDIEPDAEFEGVYIF